MLSAIEHGMVKNTVKYKPKHIIYQALPSHIGRSAGLASWDRHGPRYTLRKDGGVIYKGHYDDEDLIPWWVVTELGKSKIFTRMSHKILGKVKFDRYQIDLFIEIVNTSRRKMEILYPGCQYHVILRNGRYREEIREKLEAKGINVHLVKDIFKDFKHIKKSQLRISKHDGHPSPIAHDIIAEYVACSIIGVAPST